MKNSNTVSMYLTKEVLIAHETAGYTFKPTGRISFLQKLLWNILSKTKALQPFITQSLEVNRIDIDKKDFTTKMLAIYGSLFDRKLKPKHVYMGWDEFKILTEYNYANGYQPYIDFTIDMKYDGRLFELPVTVVDYMKGILII
jgi:hypothetical protein